ncbi:glycosyltransferase family 92 protein [Nisaea acidiphila]|uniref:Glycosyltransferase family 92 protein n=1 Tax=Nisaea acidiphila TaxID=1862145 RepID=A0A9J7AYC8_9PROT|nr:glycosyltransferase family 92 protein [Nisaea acidiphila]UUX51276.1 glycosyltransferase family 92 protein [Nisaea acidiphila]
MSQHYFTICAIFRDEARHLAEWMTFYELQGVDHFFLYDDQSVDDSKAAIQPWRDRGMVTYLRVGGGLRRQAGAYQHCLKNHKTKARWIGFFDLDEFAFSLDGKPLRDFLAANENIPGLGLNWAMYGSSGFETQPTSLVTTSYQLRAPIKYKISDPELLIPGKPRTELSSYLHPGAHIKSIVNTAEVEAYVSPHSFSYRNGAHAVDATSRPIRDTPFNAFTEEPLAGPMRVNHYWSRSLGEFSAKLETPRADSDTLRYKEMARFKEVHMSMEYDPAILPAAHAVAERLGRPYAPGTEEDWMERLQSENDRRSRA